MKVTPIKTPIVKVNDDLFAVIKNAADALPKDLVLENSVLVVTSKILSYCQGRVVAKDQKSKTEGHKSGDKDSAEPTISKQQKHNLVRQEADLYLEPHSSKYDLMLTVKNGTVAVNAGIDESNAVIDGSPDGGYILWPENLQETANQIWRFLRETYKVKNVGVIITDSKSFPLRWGVVGTCLVYCGFQMLNNFIGKKDLFGREITMVQVNVAEAVAVAAVLEMGEVAEQTPLCLVEEIKLIEFQDREPSQQELDELQIELEDDLYAPLLMNVDWKKGKK